jgi:hypothetical protein
MSWATHAKEALRRGETVQVRPRGHSMSGKVNDGDRVTLAPADPAALKVGDIVLVRIHGTDYLHVGLDGIPAEWRQSREALPNWPLYDVIASFEGSPENSQE